jgi:hypothetical protein
MVQELINKRNGILDSLRKMYEDLNLVNSEINTAVEDHNKQILALQAEVNQMASLKSQNMTSIKNLKRILGE